MQIHQATTSRLVRSGASPVRPVHRLSVGGANSLNRPQQRSSPRICNRLSRPLPIFVAAAAATEVQSDVKESAPPSASIKRDGTPVFFLGAQGRLTAQLAKALLEDGYNVIAGIDFPEQAKATLEFVKKYELLDKATLARLKTVEVSAGDTSSAALASLPRGVKVVVVEGDSLGDKKGDARYVESAVATAQAAEASQVILVNSGAPDANLFSLFTASGSNPNKALTRSEQLLATSGLSYTILRAATSSEVSSSRPPLVVPGPGALALAPAPIAPGQLTQVLQGLMALPPSPPGVQVVLEAAAAAPAINPQPLEESVPRAVSSAVAKAPPPPPASGTKKIKAAPPAPAPAPAPAPEPATGLGPFKLGTISMRAKPAEPSKASASTQSSSPPASSSGEDVGSRLLGGLGGLFGAATSTMKIGLKPPPPAADTPPAAKGTVRVVGGPKAAPPPPARKPVAPPKRGAVEEEEEEEEDAPFGFLTALFGGGAKAQVVEGEEAKPRRPAPPPPQRAAPPSAARRSVSPPPPAPAPRTANPFSTVKRTASPPPPTPTKKAAPKSRAAQEEDEEDKPAGGGFFSFFTPRPAAAKTPQPAAASRPAVRAVAAKPVAAKPAPTKLSPSKAVPAEPPKKGGGFLSLFGLGGGRDDDDEEEERPTSARRAAPPPPRRSPTPPPPPPARPQPKAAPAKAASAPAPKPSGNPFSTVKRSAAPAPPAAQKTGTQKTGTQAAKQAPKPQPKPPASGTQKVQKAAPPSRPPSSSGLPKGTYTPISGGYRIAPKDRK
ncbi:hypothetical protein V8C86DRAFT_797351 [Haematococcus lacustris]